MNSIRKIKNVLASFGREEHNLSVPVQTELPEVRVGYQGLGSVTRG